MPFLGYTIIILAIGFAAMLVAIALMALAAAS